jgi:hypothetical protein
MSSGEILAFLPSFLYGIALAELFSHWRRFFEKQYRYWPYVMTTVIFTEIAIWNVYLFLVQIQDSTLITYHEYWLFLIQPIVFLMLVHAFTPETELQDTEAYFKKRIPVVFGLTALYIALHMTPAFHVSTEAMWIRIIAIIICLIIALTRNIKVIYVFAILWLLTLYFR